LESSGIEKKSRVTGRPISEAETRGAVAGYSDVASQRLALAKEQALKEKGLATQESQYGTTLAFQKENEAQRSKEEASGLKNKEGFTGG